MKHTITLAQLRPQRPVLDPEWSAQTLSAITDLTPARPTQVEFDHMWSPTPGYRPRRLRRTALVLAATAAAIVAVVSIPSLDSGDAVAADLRGLSQAAVSYDGPVLGEGSWLHERSESLQRNDPNSKEVAVLDTHRETWTRWDGRVLVIEQRPSEGWTTYNVLDDSTAASYQDPTPVFAQTLPDNAEGLRAYLDPKVFGSSSHSEALFEALTSLATSHTLPPPTLAAAYEALADVDHVRTSHVTADGRPAIEVAYEEGLTSSTDSITVDRATGQVLTTSLHSLQSTYTTNTTLSEVVDTVPADVLTAFDEHEEDVRYDDVTGRPLD
jgi:hypothetical protein